MLKSKPLIVFTLVFAFVTLFAAGEVMAFSTEPCSSWNYTDPLSSCEPPAMPTNCANPYTVKDNVSGWTVTLCISDRGDGNKDYNYTAFNSKGTSSGLKKISWFCPKCCTYPEMRVHEDLSSASINVELAGVGSPTGALKNFLQGFVVWSPPADNISYTLVTNAQKTTEGTVLLELAGNDVPITFPVPGCAPATPPPPVGGKNFTQCINFGADTPDIPNDDISWYITRNPDVEGCAVEVWGCNAPECPGCEEGFCSNPGTLPENIECVKFEIVPSEANVILNGNVAPVCQDESIEVTVTYGSIYYLYTLNSGGITRKICYDVEQSPPVRVPRDCCKTPLGPLCPQ